ncbi:MAG: peptide ABC transporter substrate-binding protein [Dehalococcoidia bacterium]|jgi:ABC-type transport system substrate-binding protein
MNRISKIIFVVAAVIMLLPYGCSGTGETDSGNEVLVMYRGSPSTLDPANCADSTVASYMVEIFSGLVTLDSDLEVVPDIAESWNVSQDGMTYTFHLRDDAYFHDGRNVKADDFRYSMERAADPETNSRVAQAYIGDIVGVTEKLAGLADEVEGVRVVDDYTLEITIDAPKAYFLSKLTHPVAYVVDQNNVESGDDWWRDPNGTGPFKLQEWTSGIRIILERNDNYYSGVAKLDEIEFRLQGNSMMLYENGGIDIVGVGAADIDRVQDPDNPLNKELMYTPELSFFYIGFNVNVAPFNDAKVRQALCYAVDKEKIVDVLTKNTVLVAYGILPEGMPGYSEDLAGLEFNVSKAQQLLAESGYRNGLPPIVLSVQGSCSGVSSASLSIAYMWQENLGVDVRVEALDFTTLIQEARDGELHAFSVGWIADYPDPENFLDLLFYCDSVENYSGYCNSSVDALLEEARVISDYDSRMEFYHLAEEAIVQDAPCMPLWFGQNYYLVKPYVKGFNPAPAIISSLKDVWIER